MDAKPLTPAQQQVLQLLHAAHAAGRSMPTRAEIAAHFGWSSPNSANDHVIALRRKGYIKTTTGKSRSIELVDQPRGAKKRIYVAGPMTGYAELNFPMFHAATARLRGLGFEVVNPAEINPDPAAGWTACMRRDIKQLVDCDIVALLPGWQQSRGARLEVHVAETLGMPCKPLDALVFDEEAEHPLLPVSAQANAPTGSDRLCPTGSAT